MSKTLARAGLFLVCASAVIGCRGGARQEKAAPPPPQVVVAHAVSVPVRDYAEYNGYMETTQAVEIRARVRGFLMRVHFTHGTEVKKDQLLYNIDDREYVAAVAKAKADLKKATADIGNWKAQIKLAEAELDRVVQAKKSGAGAQTDVDKAAATLDVNKAQLAAAEASEKGAAAAVETAEIQLGYTEIRSPIAGLISRTLVDEGNLVGQTEATLLTTIVRVEELYVYFDVPEPQFIAFLQGRFRRFLLDANRDPVPVEVGVSSELGFPHAGVIDFHENRVDTLTGTVRVRGILKNPMRSNATRALYPGLYARVRVPKADPTPRLVIPEDALQTGQEGRFVYVVRPDNVVEKRLVTVGPNVWRTPPPERAAEEPNWALVNPNPGAAPGAKDGPPPPTRLRVQSVIAIDAGLRPDDRVIVNGIQRARPDSPVTPDEWVLTPPTPRG
jgi:RND family efflux transporter MFP subunit